MNLHTNKTCRVCGVVLDSENWYPSQKKNRNYACKKCQGVETELWRDTNPDKNNAISERARRKQGKRPFNENTACAAYLGVHVAERMLSHVFKNVKRMPYGTPGYDVICNRNKLIDIKSACLGITQQRWAFNIKHNTIADFFLCLAFDNREDLKPLYAWLIPGSKLNHLAITSISPSTIHKWDGYRLDLTKISTCCDTLRGV